MEVKKKWSRVWTHDSVLERPQVKLLVTLQSLSKIAKDALEYNITFCVLKLPLSRIKAWCCVIITPSKFPIYNLKASEATSMPVGLLHNDRSTISPPRDVTAVAKSLPASGAPAGVETLCRIPDMSNYVLDDTRLTMWKIIPGISACVIYGALISCRVSKGCEIISKIAFVRDVFCTRRSNLSTDLTYL